MASDVGRFLGGVGGVIWSPATDQYLLLQRAPDKDFAPGAWECVTGRVQQGEGFEDALHREVREEIGVDVVVDAIIGTTHFYRGPEQVENELLGVVYLCALTDIDAVKIGSEHSAFRWVMLAEAKSLLRTTHPSEAWLLRVLDRVEVLRQLLPPDLVRLNRATGFELG